MPSIDDFDLSLQSGLAPPVLIKKGDMTGEPSSPLLLSLPHSGRYYPQDFLENSACTPLELRQSEDAYVDLLLKPIAQQNLGFLLATHARSYLDLNRAANELDPQMFTPQLKIEECHISPRVRAGLGCIPRLVGLGRPIYKDRLASLTVQTRLDTLYKPYHSALKASLDARRARFGYAILIDCHSMPAPHGARPHKKPWPEIILGDYFGRSCHPFITQQAEASFLRQGLSVRRNIPYAGGFSCQHYGKPIAGLHSLQIEINRALYMDEQRLEPHINFISIAEQLCRAFTQFIQKLQDPFLTALAAE